MAGREPLSLKSLDNHRLIEAGQLMEDHGVNHHLIKRAIGGYLAQNEAGEIVLVPTNEGRSVPPRALPPDVDKKLNDLLYNPAFTDRRNWRIEQPRLQNLGKLPPPRIINNTGEPVEEPRKFGFPEQRIQKDWEMRRKFFPKDPGLHNAKRQRTLRENMLRGAE